jgi:hypothetical protein
MTARRRIARRGAPIFACALLFIIRSLMLLARPVGVPEEKSAQSVPRDRQEREFCDAKERSKGQCKVIPASHMNASV